jgi:hypothetical protein
LTKPEHHRFYSALVLFALLVGYAGAAASDECEELVKAMENKLEDFLHKKLAHELFSRKQELIAVWKSEYDRFDQVSDDIVSPTDDIKLENKKITADLAENSYLKAHAKWKDNCASD